MDTIYVRKRSIEALFNPFGPVIYSPDSTIVSSVSEGCFILGGSAGSGMRKAQNSNESFEPKLKLQDPSIRSFRFPARFASISWIAPAIVILYVSVVFQFLSLQRREAIAPDQSFQFSMLIGALFVATVGCALLSHLYRKTAAGITTAILGSLLIAVMQAFPLMSICIGYIVLLSALLIDRRDMVIASSGILFAGVLSLFPYGTPWPVAVELLWYETGLGAAGLIAATGIVLYRFIEIRYGLGERYSRIETLSNAVEELSKANLGYSTFVRFAEDQAMIEERNRITREIHDGVGYTLSNAIMLSQLGLEQLEKGDEPRVRKSLEAILVQAKAGLSDTRQSLRLLRSSETNQNRGMQGLRRMIRIFQQATGVHTTFRLLVAPRVVEHPEIFLTVYRFIQEALTNSFRHGHARHVVVTIQRDEHWLIVVIRDDGSGASTIKEGIGLAGMRERMERLGGTLTVSTPEETKSGFRVSARVPIQELEAT